MPNISSDINAVVRVHPSKSQVFLVSLLLLAGVCFLTGFNLLVEHPGVSWIPLVIGLLLTTVAIFCWKSSQKDMDMTDSNPTTIKASDGSSISTDSRMISSPESINSLIKLYSSITSRKPLPAPNGLVNDVGDIIPDSEADAIKNVDDINALSQKIANDTIDLLGIGEKIEQPIIDKTTNIDVLISNDTVQR